MLNGAEHSDGFAAVVKLARSWACDGSGGLGAMPQYASGLGRKAALENADLIQSLESVKGLIGLGLSYARCWDHRRPDEPWSRVFEAAVRGWSGAISGAEVETAFAPVWSRIHDAADRLNRQADKVRVFAEMCLLLLTVATLGGVQAGLARHFAERSGADLTGQRPVPQR